MPERISITVTSQQSYPVISDSNLDSLLGNLELPKGDKAFLIIDENVDNLHGGYVKCALQKKYNQIETFIVPAGETSKSVLMWSDIVSFVLKSGVRRNTPLFAAGGGVTGDLAGFAAASLLRGLPLYHIPTTLLAMVDSAIGGKTGINHKVGKNLIGAFYQPQAVLIDSTFLETLPVREWRCGLGEVLKYGCISDSGIFEKVRKLFTEPKPEISTELTGLIMQCAKIKADIVMQDEKESGVRAFLNFGHTFAHALEAYTKYTTYAHGEAVYIGMIAALHASALRTDNVNAQHLLKFKYLYAFLPAVYNINADQLVNFMVSDKKNRSENITLVLLEDWENPIITTENDKEVLQSSFLYAFKQLGISN